MPIDYSFRLWTEDGMLEMKLPMRQREAKTDRERNSTEKREYLETGRQNDKGRDRNKTKNIRIRRQREAERQRKRQKEDRKHKKS